MTFKCPFLPKLFYDSLFLKYLVTFSFNFSPILFHHHLPVWCLLNISTTSMPACWWDGSRESRHGIPTHSSSDSMECFLVILWNIQNSHFLSVFCVGTSFSCYLTKFTNGFHRTQEQSGIFPLPCLCPANAIFPKMWKVPQKGEKTSSKGSRN